MKAMKGLIATLLCALAISASASSTPEISVLNREIKKQVHYPAFAKAQKMQGMVLVKYNVNPDGSVTVLEMNSSHESLGQHVKETLESITVTDRRIEGSYFAKFTFRYVNM